MTDALPSYVDRPFAPPVDARSPVTIVLAGVPQGKGRPRFTVRGGFARAYTPAATRSYEGMIRTAAVDAMAGHAMFDCAVEIIMRAIFPVPASWSRPKRTRALLGEIKPGGRPDLDNILKAWTDAMNAVVYSDDSLIVRVAAEKTYGHQPAVVVTVKPA